MSNVDSVPPLSRAGLMNRAFRTMGEQRRSDPISALYNRTKGAQAIAVRSIRAFNSRLYATPPKTVYGLPGLGGFQTIHR